MITKIAKWVVRHPALIIILAVALIIPSGVGYFCTGVDYDILSFLPDQKEPGEIEDSNAVYGLNIIDDVFQSASVSIVVVENMPAKETNRIQQKVLEVEGVATCAWIGSVADMGIPLSMVPDNIKEMLYSADESATLMLIQYTPDDGSDYDSIEKVNAVKKVLDNEHFFMFGLSAVMSDTKEIINSQMFLYIVVAISLASVILVISTKQWFMPVVIMATLGCAVAYNMGTNFFFGEISYITQSVAAILQMAVTIDYSIILFDRFEEECKKTDNVRKAMAKAITYSFDSLIGGASTTFFGFIALCFMSLTLGLDLGIVMAKGIIFGILTVLIVMPAFIIQFYPIIFKYEHKCFTPNFDKIIDFVIKKKKVFAIIFVALFIPAYLLQANVTQYTDLNNKMPDDCDSRIASTKISEQFNMASIHFILISDKVPSGEVTQMVGQMENVDGITNVIALNKFIGGGISENILPDAVKDICEKGGYRLMALMSSYDLSHKAPDGTSLLATQKQDLVKIVKSYDPNGCVTGENILYDELVDIAQADFERTSVISITAIIILIAIVLKSISLPILLVASIELAIFINVAISTITGTEICFISPIVISCVQLGATVDYAILLTSRFKEEVQNGYEKHKAMSIAAKSASKSIFQSSLIFFFATIGVKFVCTIELVSGLCVLLARGALISAAVIILLLTPVLLCCEGFINKTSKGWRNPENKKEKTKRGVKSMKSKKTVQSVVSVILVIGMILGLAGCGEKQEGEQVAPQPTELYEATAQNVTKTETVYVNLNTNGSVVKTTVTDWLHTDSPMVKVYDKTDLNVNQISNVKGDTLPVVNSSDASQILWNMDSTDLYYTAETTKATPIGIGIKYFLNGKEMTAEEIAGKSGQVKIEFTFNNNYSKAVKVNGETRKMYLPMLVVGGMILPESKYSGISAVNGKAIGDGSNEIVMLYNFPGLSESLNITNKDLQGYGSIDLSNKASVTATTDKFEIGNMYFAAIPVASLDLDFDAAGSVDSLQSTLRVVKSLMNSIQNIDVNSLINTLSTNSAGIAELSGVINNAIGVYESNEKLLNTLTKTLTPQNIAILKELLNDLNDKDVQQALSTVTNSAFLKSLMNITEIADDIQKAQPILDELNKSLNDPEIQQSLNNIDTTINTLNQLQTEIEKNKNLINTLSTIMSDENMDALSNASKILANSNVDLSSYGIVVEDTDAFVASCEAWFNVGKGYSIFTNASSNMKTNVAFIYMTPSITSGHQDKQAQPEVQEEEDLPWYKKIINYIFN